MTALQTALAIDDAGEDLGAHPDDRITCHPCQSWADHAHDLTGAHLTTPAAETRFPGSTTAYQQEWAAAQLLDAYHAHPHHYPYIDPTDLPAVTGPDHLDACVDLVDTARDAHHGDTTALDGPDLTAEQGADLAATADLGL
jgi:hypothetical protein